MAARTNRITLLLIIAAVVFTTCQREMPRDEYGLTFAHYVIYDSVVSRLEKACQLEPGYHVIETKQASRVRADVLVKLSGDEHDAARNLETLDPANHSLGGLQRRGYRVVSFDSHHKKPPHRNDVILSPIGFSRSNRSAAVLGGCTCGSTCGVSALYLFKRDNGVWELTKVHVLGVS